MRVCRACQVYWAGRGGCWCCGRFGHAIAPSDPRLSQASTHTFQVDSSTVETLEPLVEVAGV